MCFVFLAVVVALTASVSASACSVWTCTEDADCCINYVYESDFQIESAAQAASRDNEMRSNLHESNGIEAKHILLNFKTPCISHPYRSTSSFAVPVSRKPYQGHVSDAALGHLTSQSAELARSAN
ncbi:hypothetical protein F4604DRAFT_1679137 [Suillus subluteus]|nr:hypothetical protein F4604DRAFT_1679137 [Suillus subluteus]